MYPLFKHICLNKNKPLLSVLNICLHRLNKLGNLAVPWIRWLVGGLSSRTPRPCKSSDGQSGTGTGFPPNMSGFLFAV